MENIEDEVIVQNESLILGEIFMNRVVGIAYKNLEKIKKFPQISEFNRSLRTVYELNVKKALRYRNHIKYLSSLLKGAGFKYALLKGAYLNTQLYDIGLRTSNDIDILINEKDITELQKILINNGFIQGSYDRKNGLIPATRKEIILSRMNYGETIPFIKLIDEEPMEIDLNFSLDYKPENGSNTVDIMLNNIIDVIFEDISFKSLDLDDFFIHLCCHLFKEATTYDWVVRRCDLELYKFSDINIMIHEKFTSSFVKKLINRIIELNVKKECYFTIYNTILLYPNLKKIDGLIDLLNNIRPDDLSYMKQIINPEFNKIHFYDMDFLDWFNMDNRVESLKELFISEK